MFALLVATSMLSSSFGFVPCRQTNINARLGVSLEMARRKFISGNWKLNPQTKSEANTLAADIAASITSESPKADVALFVPYPFIDSVMSKVGDKMLIGGEVRNFAWVRDYTDSNFLRLIVMTRCCFN
jgi:triosephosphate isomerase (TIM)